MARLTLFTVLSLLTWFGVMADSPEADAESRLAEEDDSSDRLASASAQAHATAQGGGINVHQRYPTPKVTPGLQKGVRCFTCSNCPHGNVTTSKICPASNDPAKNGKCVVFSEKYYHLKEPFVVRGCASDRGLCSEIRSAVEPQSELVKVLSCRECEGDMCNGAGQFTANLVTGLVAMFVTPLLMKYTLS